MNFILIFNSSIWMRYIETASVIFSLSPVIPSFNHNSFYTLHFYTTSARIFCFVHTNLDPTLTASFFCAFPAALPCNGFLRILLRTLVHTFSVPLMFLCFSGISVFPFADPFLLIFRFRLNLADSHPSWVDTMLQSLDLGLGYI